MLRRRKILQMDDEELRAVVAIVLPGRRGDELTSEAMQEMCIKWLFANGLSINHVFEFHEADGELFCVMRNAEACWCCPKATQTVTLSEFDRGPIGDNFQRTPSPSRKKSSNKIAPITVQPTIINVPDERKEADEAKKTSSCGYCKRECGLCIVNLCSQC